MRGRFFLSVLLFAGILLPLTSCSTDPSLTSIVISPTTYTAVASPPGDPQVTTNFTATGYYTHPGHTAGTKDLPASDTWYSYTPAMVTINSDGVATVTGAMYGSTQITASAQGFNGIIISNTATYNVSAPNSSTNSDIVSIAVQPASPSVAAANLPVGFSAIGTTGTGHQVALASGVVWTSSNLGVATINANTGAGTTQGAGTSTITATYTNPNDGMMVTGFTILTVQ